MNRNIDFVKNRKIYYIVSAVLFAITIAVTAIFGVEVNIEFKGGSIATYSYKDEIKISDVQQFVKVTTGHDCAVRLSENNVTDQKNVVISISEELSSEEQTKMTTALEKEYKENGLELVESSSVDAMNGKSFFVKCLIAAVVALALIIVYIAFRFRKIGGWTAGITAVIALVHDLVIAYAVYAIFRIEIGGNFMAVMLTILGYSVNDTIVVFDRIRENNTMYGKKLSIIDNVNLSLNQSLGRTINTTFMTLVALAVIVVVSLIFGITSMFDFVFPMSVGLVSGVYSSICLSPNIWASWKLRKKKR